MYTFIEVKRGGLGNFLTSKHLRIYQERLCDSLADVRVEKESFGLAKCKTLQHLAIAVVVEIGQKIEILFDHRLFPVPPFPSFLASPT